MKVNTLTPTYRKVADLYRSVAHCFHCKRGVYYGQQKTFESSTDIALIQQTNNETRIRQTARSHIPPKGIQPINWIPLHLGGDLKEHWHSIVVTMVIMVTRWSHLTNILLHTLFAQRFIMVNLYTQEVRCWGVQLLLHHFCSWKDNSKIDLNDLNCVHVDWMVVVQYLHNML